MNITARQELQLNDPLSVCIHCLVSCRLSISDRLGICPPIRCNHLTFPLECRATLDWGSIKFSGCHCRLSGRSDRSQSRARGGCQGRNAYRWEVKPRKVVWRRFCSRCGRTRAYATASSQATQWWLTADILSRIRNNRRNWRRTLDNIRLN